MTDEHTHVEGSGSEMTFDHPESARRVRDSISTIVEAQITEMRPNDQYGVVTGIDPDRRQVWVEINNSGDSIPVHVGALMPKEVGQRVRVSQVRPGDMVVVDVYGQAMLTGETSDDLPAVTGLTVNGGYDSLYVSWTNVGAPKYQVEVAEDSGFTTAVRGPFVTQSTSLSVNDLTAGTDYWTRVRATNEAISSWGDWASTGPDQPNAVPSGSDGSPPDSPSPQPSVYSGIGLVSAEWVAATGTTDTVTYEVHVSLSSGFTPGAGTLLDETTSRFVVITHLPDGTSLQNHYGENVFVRLIAKDDDGTATVGAQGFAAPQQVELGDVGSIPVDNLSDGSAPASSPTPTIQPGFGYLYLKWDHITNDDPVEYEIHLSTNSSFTPVANTLIGVTPSNWFFARKLSAQAQGTIGDTNDATVDTNDASNETGFDTLPWGTVFYLKIVATDADGSASPGGEVSGAAIRIDTDAIEFAAITEAVIADAAITRAKILDLAVDSAKISNAAITEAKIGYLAVGQANIQLASIDEARIGDLAVSTAKIQNLAVTDAKIDTLTATKITTGTLESGDITVDTGAVVKSANFGASAGWELAPSSFTMRGGSIDFGNFTVDASGNLTCSNASISGAITGGTISIGSGDTIFKVASDGDMWIGDANQNDAPFRADNNGDVKITDADINGDITMLTSGVIKTRASGHRAELGYTTHAFGANTLAGLVLYDGAGTPRKGMIGTTSGGTVYMVPPGGGAQDGFATYFNSGTTNYSLADTTEFWSSAGECTVDITGKLIVDSGVGATGGVADFTASDSSIAIKKVGTGTAAAWNSQMMVVSDNRSTGNGNPGMSFRSGIYNYAAILRLSSAAANRLIVRNSTDGGNGNLQVQVIYYNGGSLGSRRGIKQNIRGMDVDPNMLHDLHPQLWDRAPGYNDPEAPDDHNRSAGWIVEELVEKYPQAVSWKHMEPDELEHFGLEAGEMHPYGYEEAVMLSTLWALTAKIEKRLAALESA